MLICIFITIIFLKWELLLLQIRNKLVHKYFRYLENQLLKLSPKRFFFLEYSIKYHDF